MSKYFFALITRALRGIRLNMWRGLRSRRTQDKTEGLCTDYVGTTVHALNKMHSYNGRVKLIWEKNTA